VLCIYEHEGNCGFSAMVVWLFPYLPTSDRLTVGPWTLIPRAALTDDDAISAEAAERARGVAALYRMPGDDRGFGAFVRSEQSAVGAEVDENAIWRLYQAVVTALLDRNASPAEPREEDINAGHATCTVENARLHGQGVDDQGYTAFSYGVMVQQLVGGYQVGRDTAKIEPPHELNLPILGRGGVDDVYVNALYEVLSNLDEDSPDLPGAIRFLEVAWANSLSVRTEARILALRAGFDVLFGGADTRTVRDNLSALLDRADAPRTRRVWTDHARHREADLTDLQWWFQSFALLRNKVAHGGQLDAAEYEFDDGVHHIWHAELNLRRAIKKLIANAGHEDVLLGPFERIARKHARGVEAIEAGEEEQDDVPDVTRLL
jgi:hypothetical protein